MRMKWRKCSQVVTGCFAVVCLLYFVNLIDHQNLFESEFEIKTSYSRMDSKKLEHVHTKIENNKGGALKINPTNDMLRSNTSMFPFYLSRTGSWSGTDINRSAFVFSAYLVNEDEVVVIGIKAKNIIPYYCQLWYQNQTKEKMELEKQQAKIITVPEGHGLRYTPVLFHCPLPSSTRFPTHISIIPASCKKPLNLLEIGGFKKKYVINRKFTVCLTPLNFEYNRDYEMIEWIELNRILGADKFIVYNYSSAKNVQDVLEYYTKRGITEVVQWDIPVSVDSSKPEVHYFGQVAALQDCLYRNKGISEFVVNLDLDEFIIPHGNTTQTWSHMIKQINHDSKVYLFRNTFFKKEWNNSDVEIQNKSLVDKLQLVTLQKLQHERKLFKPKQRSKYIAKTTHVSRLMVHDVPGIRNWVVSADIAYLHHYRDWGSNNDPEQNKVLDNTVPNKFGKILLEHVITVRNDIDKHYK